MHSAFGEQWGYDEINLNCGCPSERVQRGAFGACLMAEPELVAQCVRAMRAAVAIPVTVKHRLGLDHDEDHAFVRRFVQALEDAGCATVIVHARNAVLKGLSHILPHTHVLNLKTEDFSRDPKAVQAMHDDPLIAGEVQPTRTVAAGSPPGGGVGLKVQPERSGG